MITLASAGDDIVVNFHDEPNNLANFEGEKSKRARKEEKRRKKEKVSGGIDTQDAGVEGEGSKKKRKVKCLNDAPHPDGDVSNLLVKERRRKKKEERKRRRKTEGLAGSYYPQDDDQQRKKTNEKKRTQESPVDHHSVEHSEGAINDVKKIQKQNSLPFNEVRNAAADNCVKSVEAKAGSIIGSENQVVAAATTHTVSIAVAGSIVDNAQSLELATMLAGQIARAATIFRIDEVVVFDDDGQPNNMQDEEAEEKAGAFMVRILKHLEVPQYLRRSLVCKHQSLRSVGRLPPLDAPHHLRKHEWRPFREGVATNKRALSSPGSYVDVGLDKEVLVDQSLKPGTRVTVAMDHSKEDKVLHIVDSEEVRQAGIYWGYRVRYASCLSAVFDECPFEGKYDYSIGTSEHGTKVSSTEFFIPKFKHLLIAFGGLAGLEESLELDKGLMGCNIKTVFDQYVNTCPNQGSRTIRTEEAILISLQYLQEAIQRAIDSA